jgi:hypothetical protein
MTSSLEDLCIAAYLQALCNASADLLSRRSASGDQIGALRQAARASLGEILGGVSSVASGTCPSWCASDSRI